MAADMRTRTKEKVETEGKKRTCSQYGTIVPACSIGRLDLKRYCTATALENAFDLPGNIIFCVYQANRFQ